MRNKRHVHLGRHNFSVHKDTGLGVTGIRLCEYIFFTVSHTVLYRTTFLSCAARQRVAVRGGARLGDWSGIGRCWRFNGANGGSLR